ncbi:MAG: hypothetical protein WC852_02565 [Candidatus Nanoarchaeia archaeon]
MSRIIGDRKEKSALDEMEEVARARNRDVAEEERLEVLRKAKIEEERIAREEAERKAKKEKPLIQAPSKPLITEPTDGDIVKLCGEKELLKNDYEVLKDIYRNSFFTPEGEYTTGNIRIEDKRVIEIRATEHGMIGLPESISRLDKIECLYFGVNKISSLPKSLEAMGWLKNAFFHFNPLDDKSKKMLDRMKKNGIEAGYSEWM